MASLAGRQAKPGRPAPQNRVGPRQGRCCIPSRAPLSTRFAGFGVSPSGKAAVFGTAIPRFES
jgi:hypothetical protein